jgi:hypothetical protein
MTTCEHDDPDEEPEYRYAPIFRSGRWMIAVTEHGPNAGEPFFMTCGYPTEAEVLARIGWLRQDDDKIIALTSGAPHKYH